MTNCVRGVGNPESVNQSIDHVIYDTVRWVYRVCALHTEIHRISRLLQLGLL